ncbi:MAG: winged helix-turn-helix domain-containing protein [Pseudomonadota bacterium]
MLLDESGVELHLRKQSLQVLEVLAAQPGQLVSRESIVEKVWGQITTTDDSLVQCIADIRRALGRDAVKTFPKKGYLLKAEQMVTAPKVEQTAGRMRPWPVTMALALTVIALWVVWRAVTAPHDPADHDAIVPPAIKHDKTLAVLPFTDLSGSADTTYFGTGLAEDLATDLSKVAGLTVIAYASSGDFVDAESGFQAIAKDLGVRYLIRGTVRHHADRMRINVSLIDPFDGFNLWAERYDRLKDNPFDVQEEVTRQIINALALKLDLTADTSARIAPDAVTLLLRGLEALRSPLPEQNLAARDFFDRAITLDPTYARAHASLALTYARENLLSGAAQFNPMSIEAGLQAAIRAIQLNDKLPHAYYALGVLNLSLGEYDNAVAAARHALRIDVNFASGYALLAEVALYGGDLDEALRSIRRARLLHPHHPPSFLWTEGHILFQQQNYQQAEEVLARAHAVDDSHKSGLIIQAANLAMLGREADANLVLTTNALSATAQQIAADIPFLLKQREEHLKEALAKLAL